MQKCVTKTDTSGHCLVGRTLSMYGKASSLAPAAVAPAALLATGSAAATAALPSSTSNMEQLVPARDFSKTRSLAGWPEYDSDP